MSNSIDDILETVLSIVPNDLDFRGTAGIVSSILNYHLKGKNICSEDGNWRIESVFLGDDERIYVKVSRGTFINKEESLVVMFNDLVEYVFNEYNNTYDFIVDYVLDDMGLYDTLEKSNDVKNDFMKYYKEFLRNLMDERLKSFTSFIMKYLRFNYYDTICELDEVLIEMDEYSSEIGKR